MRSPGRNPRMLALALTLVAIGPAAAQTLNPVVTVLPRPTSTVPNGCEESLAPPVVPRVMPEEKRNAVPAPAPEAPLPPPSTTLRGTLHDLQSAAERSDKEAFTTALARTASI